GGRPAARGLRLGPEAALEAGRRAAGASRMGPPDLQALGPEGRERAAAGRSLPRPALGRARAAGRTPLVVPGRATPAQVQRADPRARSMPAVCDPSVTARSESTSPRASRSETT